MPPWPPILQGEHFSTWFLMVETQNTKHVFSTKWPKKKKSNRFQLLWPSWDILSLSSVQVLCGCYLLKKERKSLKMANLNKNFLFFNHSHSPASYIEIQDQVKIWRPNSWNVTHSYRRSFSNKFFIFEFFFKISTATPHKHPYPTFVLVFGMTLEIKTWEKPFLIFINFPWKLS